MPRKAVRHADLSSLRRAVHAVCGRVFQATFGLTWNEAWVADLRNHRDMLIREDRTAARTRRSSHAAMAALRRHGVDPDGDLENVVGHSPRLGRLYFGLNKPVPPTGKGTDLPRFKNTETFVVAIFDVLYVSLGVDASWALDDDGAGSRGRERLAARLATNRQLAALFLLIDERGVVEAHVNCTAAEVVELATERIGRVRRGKAMQMPEWLYAEIGATEHLRDGEIATWFPPEPQRRK